ncbi:MAG: sigma 54-interacting transcriptional regulator [Syntrophales bacterium]
MTEAEKFLLRLPDDEQLILYHFVSFPNFFSVDWFSEFPPSRLMSVILSLERHQWILPRQGGRGYYGWSSKCPRQDLIDRIPPDQMSRYYRNSADILLKNLPADDDVTLMVARQCLLAGLQGSDLDVILKAAHIEEKNHRLSSAVSFYDSILEFIEKLISGKDDELPETTWRTFIDAIERRVSLSLFHPSLKKIDRLLLIALDTARRRRDMRSDASLELLIGQNDWMYFQYEKAVLHFNRGWHIIKEIDDEELHKWGLKVQGLTFIIKGQFFKAIEAYEQSLGELESADNSDFFQLVALNLALCYTQVGMPQRGLGISDAIQNHCQKSANWPLLSYALVTAGIILLEIKQMKTSRSYFERALDLARRENIPMVEVLAGIGLASIECQEGNFDLAAEHYKALWRIRKSSWYHILNFYPLLDTGYILHSRGVSPIDLKPVFEFLYHLKKDEVNPLMYGMIQRLQLGLPENKTSTTDKISILTELEKTVERMGATFELAKIRVELARLFNQTNDWRKAESYAWKAYEFFKPIAKDCFPPDLQHLIPHDNSAKDDRLFDLVVEMGNALTDQENIERLLTSIITSISRLTGSERAALFIKDEDTFDLKLIASRNLLKEELEDDTFGETMDVIKSAATSSEGKIIEHEINGDGSANFRRIIITPLKLGKKIMGVLYQDSRFFSLDMSPDIIKLLSAFAPQIAVSIDRAQAYDEIARLNKKLIQENLYYIEEKEEFRPFGEIIGNGSAILSLHRLIQKVAPTQSTVLIHGETGVGKELIARAIHRESPRKDGPFIRVNCAALPDTLIDSELFGHEKGSFTGAIKTKAGRFELAHLGTIFLDEVSELPLSTQSRLLRILQDKEFQRVGGTKVLHSDFRLITATNKDLNQEVASGKFRADLFYRLNVFPIHVPPLRERGEDIPALATHFLKLFCSLSNKEYSGIPKSEMEKLKAYPWPGNIRELSNMVERAVILGEKQIRFPELADKEDKYPVVDGDLKLKDMERRRILGALRKAGGKVGGNDGAAALLGLNRTTLIHRMKKLGIKVEHHQAVLDTLAKS